MQWLYSRWLKGLVEIISGWSEVGWVIRLRGDPEGDRT
jgi:hypothetical protein